MCTGYAEVSNDVTGPMPHLPSSNPDQNFCRPEPIGETTPTPVITTRSIRVKRLLKLPNPGRRRYCSEGASRYTEVHQLPIAVPWYADNWRGRSYAMKVAFALASLAGAGALLWAAESGSWFADITHAAGIDNRHTNRAFHNPYAKIMAGYTALGAAVAVADYDGDGYDDVFVTDSGVDG